MRSQLSLTILFFTLLTLSTAAPPTGDILISLQSEALESAAEASVPDAAEVTGTMKPKRMLAEDEEEDTLEKRFRAVKARPTATAGAKDKRFRAVKAQPSAATKEKREADPEAEAEAFRAVQARPSTHDKREAEAEPFRAVHARPTKRDAEAEPFRAVKARPTQNEKREAEAEAEPFRAVKLRPTTLDRREAEAEPFRAVKARPTTLDKREAEAEPFRAVQARPTTIAKREAEAEPFRAVKARPTTLDKREAEAEPFRAVKARPTTLDKREAEAEPFRAVQARPTTIAKREAEAEPFRAVKARPTTLDKREAEAEPFRAVKARPTTLDKREAEAEPFRAVHARPTKREAEAKPFRAVQARPIQKEKREAEAEPFRAVKARPTPAHDKRDPFRAVHDNKPHLPYVKRDPIHFVQPAPPKHHERDEESSLARMAKMIKRSSFWMWKREPEHFQDESNEATPATPVVVQARSTSPHDKRSPFGHGQEMRKMIKKMKREAEALEQRDTEETLEARGEQYPLSSAAYTTISFSSAAGTKASSSATPATTSSSTSSSMPDYWYGASSYYLFALADSERYQVLDALKDGGFKVIRIFIASVQQNNKGSNNAAVNDLEPKEIGTYDDTILTKVDQLMYDCSQRGLKLLIALDDRYALGFWSTNVYATQLNIVASGSSGVQKVSNAGAFYSNTWAIKMFEQRLAHILQHKNALMDYKTWAELDDVVYAFEPQNEPQGYMTVANPTWVCDRAAYLKTLLPSGSPILVGSGGGVTTTTSLQSWATGCSSIDIVSVHDYGTDASTTANALVNAAKGVASGKIVMMGEWGITGANKASIVQSFVNAFKAAGLPWMYWEIVKPGKAASDFEVWTDEPSWAALTGGAVSAATTTAWTSTKAAGTTQAWSSSSQKAWSSSAPAWTSTSAWSPSTTTTWTPQASATQDSWSSQS